MRVVIIGGGHAGADLAKRLDSLAQVTLIERREAFVHTPAAIRALVDDSLLEKIVFPYDSLLKNGNVVKARVESVRESGALLDSGKIITGDIMVVATGSSNALPLKPEGDSIEGFRKASGETAVKIREANSIAVVGGGAVGVELAGEISAAHPRKRVTLIASGKTLVPEAPKKFGRRLAAKLAKAGVRIIAEAKAVNLVDAKRPYPGTVLLSTGESVTADLVFPAVGSRPGLGGIKFSPELSLSRSGRIVTDQWMRVPNTPGLFAIGDAAETGDRMTIVGISMQVPWLVKAIKAIMAGKKIDRVRPYMPWTNPPLIVPLGPTKGASQLPIGVYGDLATRMIKGKHLFIPKYQKLLGAKNGQGSKQE